MKPLRLKGKIKFYNEDKAFGFIVRADGQPSVSAHACDGSLRTAVLSHT
jgi:cold shock CspA family protein